MKSLSHQAQHLYATLKEQLSLLDEQYSSFIPHTRAAIALCRQALLALKEAFSQYSFTGPAEEIEFFKSVKPPFLAELVYYKQLYVHHTRLPSGSIERQQQYLHNA